MNDSIVRPISRVLARELSVEEIAKVSGGTVSGTLNPPTCSVDDEGGGTCPDGWPAPKNTKGT